MQYFTRLAVIGAGAWGSALAQTARRAGRQVCLWAHEPETARAITEDHANPDYLPDVALDPGITATADLAQALAGAEAVLLVTPAQHLATVGAQAAAHWPLGRGGRPVPAVICAKGIALDSGRLMSQEAARVLPAGTPLAALSGPTFAAEVARGLPTAVTLACADAELGAALVETLGGPSFRPYLSDDLIGAEVGGAVKNVLAIACGIVEGRGLGDNARAALITRGLAEITRLAVALGGQPGTVMGLCGLGDLMLTASSLQSRNYSLGVAVGQGHSAAQVMAGRRAVTEGVSTAQALAGLAETLGVEMPICQAVNAIVHQDADLDDTISGLLNRPFKMEGN
ncbi:NAD(P)H-dependent glycerol-3-phosphate dehydrogenase [Roseospirillum parvum]|uniref:Glycerol-3-phosphate dehydrogenase [NAD(P)+] n=1 Tax=Roseospirillum parvum TaxID=83401 RepID=A0A1G8DG44_9PROT|nr:NAD(P)H-dependent glycerol-3-phosphate dehydrogenase [Roseospirillum parvum]SDH56652.1 glycerol-3-phosphate dehydrogenase (NAD(P)+) [Roseospirillum parvum]